MKDVIKEFDLYLFQKKLRFSATVIGGTALILLDIVARFTKDVDCLDPNIPDEIKQAALDFAHERKDLQLLDNWLNNGPDSLKRELPNNWRTNCVEIFKGKAITLFTLCRSDLLKSKLFACCDRGSDYDDCILLNPSLEELEEAFSWVADRDANPGWPDHVRVVFNKIKKDKGYV